MGYSGHQCKDVVLSGHAIIKNRGWQGQGCGALVVFGSELVAEEARRGAHGLLDDPGALCHPRDQLEGVVAIPVAPCQKPAITAHCCLPRPFRIPHPQKMTKRGTQKTPFDHHTLP